MVYPKRSQAYWHWLIFTLLCGGLPIIFRFFIATASGSAFADKGITLDYFVFSDLIFLGLILNASAMANAATIPQTPKAYGMILFFAICLSMLLVGLYAIDMIVRLSPYWLAWGYVLFLIFCSFVLSHYTTDASTMSVLQKTLDAKDLLNSFDQPIQQELEEILCRKHKDQQVNLKQEIDLLWEKYGHPAQYVKKDRREIVAEIIVRLQSMPHKRNTDL